MKPTDFHIGQEFVASAGFRWRCTDIGTRTILAIRIEDDRDPSWYAGPPYAVNEEVFDEESLRTCHRDEREAIEYAIHQADTSGHPGYPHEVVFRMLDARTKSTYPHKRLLRLDRLREDGELLHPYAARKDGDTWLVQMYLPFREEFQEMPERVFLGLRIARALRRRSVEPGDVGW